MFDDIIQPKEEFYGGDDNPIEFEADWELDEDANVSYSFGDLEKALGMEDEQLEKAIDDAMKELFGDDCSAVPEHKDQDDEKMVDETCDCGDECNKCAILPEPDCCEDAECCCEETVPERPRAWGI